MKKVMTLFVISTLLLTGSVITAWSADIKVVEVFAFDMFGEDAHALKGGMYLGVSNMEATIKGAPPLSYYTKTGWKIINIERIDKDWHRMTLQKEEGQLDRPHYERGDEFIIEKYKNHGGK